MSDDLAGTFGKLGGFAIVLAHRRQGRANDGYSGSCPLFRRHASTLLYLHAAVGDRPKQVANPASLARPNQPAGRALEVGALGFARRRPWHRSCYSAGITVFGGAAMIPVLNYADFVEGKKDSFVADVGQACRQSGFMLLANHGIDRSLIDEVFACARTFFALDLEEKERLSIANSKHDRGYAALGSEKLDEKSGLIDQKEAFNVGADLSPDDPRVLIGMPFRGVNQWPAGMEEFRETLMTYYRAMERLGLGIHKAIALDLGLDEDYFQPLLDDPIAILRLLRYPPSRGIDGDIGAGAHSDYGSITLLMTDGTAGLQVKPRGSDTWMDVPHVENAFVVNLGDLLMRWTNDIYVSTPHRVIPPKKERYSIAFFLQPNPDVVVEALPGTGDTAHYKPITSADYLHQRLTATYA
jgi:isopenicillin N synthase-like dioxygenase